MTQSNGTLDGCVPDVRRKVHELMETLKVAALTPAESVALFAIATGAAAWTSSPAAGSVNYCRPPHMAVNRVTFN